MYQHRAGPAVIALCFAAYVAADEEKTDASGAETRTLLDDSRRLRELRNLERTFTLSEQRLKQEVLTSSRSHLSDFLESLHVEEERFYLLARKHPGNERVRRAALAAALLRKGRSVAEAAGTARAISQSLDAQGRDTFEHLRHLRAQFAMLSLAGPGRLAPAKHQQRLKQLAEEGDAIEAELAQRSAPLRALTALPGPGEIVDSVAAALPTDSALVEFVVYEEGLPLSPGAGAPHARTPRRLRYLALVLSPDARVQALDLGLAAPIDAAASRFRDALARNEAAFQAPAQALYALAFRPLLPLLKGARRLFLSPDGQLALIPFAALHDGQGFLVDTFDIIYVISGRDLLLRPSSGPPGPMIILAAPDFGTPPSAGQPSRSGEPPRGRRAALARSCATATAEFADTSWVSLPGTREEAEALHRLVPNAQLFLGRDATKERLLHLPTPGVLHIATHGFFLEGSDAAKGSRGVGPFSDSGPVPRPREPLLRSGLVLAGERASSARGARAPGASRDGALVTALELSDLNLWGTELVVLSACDTGRGDVRPGQGVYGLRHALVVAGAEAVVTSLWKVDDETTRVLMEAYYRNLLAGQGRATALNGAMRSLRETQPHPHFWAPFIAIGRDAPLRALSPSLQAGAGRERGSGP